MPPTSATVPEAKPNWHSPGSPAALRGVLRTYILVFAFGAALIGGVLWHLVRGEYRQVMAYWKARQSSIADDRGRMVSNWLDERRADADVLARLPSVKALASRQPKSVWATLPRREVERHVSEILDRAAPGYGYAAIYVLDMEGRVVARATGSADLGSSEAEAYRRPLRTGKFHVELLDGTGGKTLLSFSTPVFAEDVAPPRADYPASAVGVVVLVADPARGLFPLLTGEAVPTRTGETVLVRREGNEAVYLSPLRHLSVGAARLRRPLRDPTFAARVALEGRGTFGEFTDYRGVRVLAATRRIPQTGWVLVRKIDYEEALAQFHRTAVVEGLVAGLVILSLGGLLWGFRRTQVAQAFRAEVERQRAILKLEEYAQEIVDSIPAGLLVLSSDLHVLSANRFFLEFFGLRNEDAIGRRLDEVIQAEGPPYGVTTALEGGFLPQGALINVTVGTRGETRPVRLTLEGIELEQEEGRLLLVIEDQTASERLRLVAEASERRLRDLVQDLDAIVWQAEAATFRFTFVSQRAEKVLGYPIEEWLSEPEFWANHIAPADREATLALRRAATAEGRDHELDYRMVAADGLLVWLRDRVRVVLDVQGRAQLRGLMVDTTEQKRAEAELCRVNRALKTLSESNQALVRATEEPDLLREICRIIAEVGGYRFVWVGYAEPDGTKTVRPVAYAGFEEGYLETLGITWADTERGRGPTGTAIRTAQPCIARSILTDPNLAPWHAAATKRGYTSAAAFPLIAEGQALGALSIYATEPDAFDAEEVKLLEELARDLTHGIVTLRRRAEHDRAEAENARLITAVEQAAEGIVITDLAGEIQYVNPAFTWITGYSREEAVGQNPRILKSGKQDPLFYRHLWETIRAGQTWQGEIINRRKDGSLYTEQMTITPVRNERGEITHFIAIKQDVTERQRLQEQLRQAQKMEAVGRLAGGIAHDFNNLLTIITGYGQLLLDRLAASDPLREHASEILKAGNRAASLTRQLLAFSRRQVLAPQVLDLNAIVANVEKMLRRLIGEDIELVTAPGGDLGRVRADPGQLEQVIMNLALNARDAMPQGGKLTLETRNVELDETYTRDHFPVTPGPYVLLAVSDTGRGMDAETQAHIFEPFFTTKEQSKGTGLGLAMVYGIVKQSGGYIWVYSELGKGTTFKVYLPRAEEAVGGIEPREGAAALRKGSETVLVVEDEAALRALVRGLLEANGYTVLEARNGEDALSVCEQHKGPIHLLLTDVVMPQMSGPELVEHLAPFHREMKVIYMSGYTDEAIVHHGMLDGGKAYLQKPFTPEALARKVREVLDAD